MCNGPHKRTTLTTGGKRNRQKPKMNRKPRFFLQNLPKPTDSKIFETVTTLVGAETNSCPNVTVLALIFRQLQDYLQRDKSHSASDVASDKEMATLKIASRWSKCYCGPQWKEHLLDPKKNRYLRHAQKPHSHIHMGLKLIMLTTN